jgi:hypothetical protein
LFFAILRIWIQFYLEWFQRYRGILCLPCSWLQREVDPRDLASFLSLERDPRTTRFIIWGLPTRFYSFYPFISGYINLYWSPFSFGCFLLFFFGLLCWTVSALVLNYGSIFSPWIIQLQVFHLQCIDIHID